MEHKVYNSGILINDRMKLHMDLHTVFQLARKKKATNLFRKIALRPSILCVIVKPILLTS